MKIMKKIETNNWFLNFVFTAYFSKKESDSRLVAKGSPKTKTISFNFISEYQKIIKTNDYIQKNLKYVADPITFDYYTHPETVQSEVNTSKTTYGKDCDDFSCFAYKVLRDSGIPENNISVVSIIPEINLNTLDNIKWAHVLLVGFYYDLDNKQSWCYVIDTNGLNWFPTNDCRGLLFEENLKAVKDKILAKFSDIYKKTDTFNGLKGKYCLLIDHGYPF